MSLHSPTENQGAHVLACACTLLVGATVAFGQSGDRGPDERAARAADVIIEVLDGERNPLLDVVASARTASGAIVKGIVLPNGTCLISGLAGEVKLAFEHATGGSAEVMYTPTAQAIDYIQVELDRGRATLLPVPADTSERNPGGALNFREDFCDDAKLHAGVDQNFIYDLQRLLDWKAVE